MEGALCDAIALGNFELAVKLFIHLGDWAHAIALALSGGSELLGRTLEQFYKVTDAI